MNRPRKATWLRTAGLALTACACLAALGFYLFYRNDAAIIRDQATQVTRGIELPSEKARVLMTWVHNRSGTKANPSYFLLRRLRATPTAVLAGGGDCADKARLLSAMLREVGIPATMAMCFNQTTGQPTHTVVEAVVARGTRMVLDPAYDLCFPTADGSSYHGLLSLRHDPTILLDRLDGLWYDRPYPSPIHSYDFNSASYTAAATINWNKSAITRWLHDILHKRIGEKIYQLPRPLALEEPKLFACTACLALAAIILMILGVVPLASRVARRVFGAAESAQTSGKPAACWCIKSGVRRHVEAHQPRANVDEDETILATQESGK